MEKNIKMVDFSDKLNSLFLRYKELAISKNLPHWRNDFR